MCYVPVGNLGDSGVLRIDFTDEILYGIDIEINNESSVNWTGTQFDWNGDLDVENITVNITTHPFQITSISTITLSLLKVLHLSYWKQNKCLEMEHLW